MKAWLSAPPIKSRPSCAHLLSDLAMSSAVLMARDQGNFERAEEYPAAEEYPPNSRA